jgi:hypothetical protein
LSLGKADCPVCSTRTDLTWQQATTGDGEACGFEMVIECDQCEETSIHDGPFSREQRKAIDRGDE